jgi:hypothetical protein
MSPPLPPHDPTFPPSPAQLQAEADRRHAWEKVWCKEPRPATPAGLQAECQRLRAILADPGETRLLTVARAPEVVGRLWDAMRVMGGVVPEQPDLEPCTEAAAFADVITDNARRAALQRAVDTAFAWCETRVRPTALPRPRLTLDGESVYLDGSLVPLDGTPEGREEMRLYLGALLQAGGNWLSGREIQEGVRWERVRKRLPQVLLDLTETNRRKGNRLKPEAWRR